MSEVQVDSFLSHDHDPHTTLREMGHGTVQSAIHFEKVYNVQKLVYFTN
jgi:hypothetical protein